MRFAEMRLRHSNKTQFVIPSAAFVIPSAAFVIASAAKQSSFFSCFIACAGDNKLNSVGL